MRASFFLLFIISCLTTVAVEKKPNVLWIYIEDQHPWYKATGEGQQLVETPNFDSLAKEGVLFEKAFVPNPVCSACRSSVITGQYGIRNGTLNHRSSRYEGSFIYLDKPTLPEIFRKADYFTYNNGKDDYNFRRDRRLLYSAGNPKGDEPFFGSRGKGDWKERVKGQPFFGQIQTNGGKLSYRMSTVTKLIGGKDQLTDPAKIIVPPQYPDIAEIRKDIAAHYDTVKASDIQIGQIVKRLKDEGEWDNTILFVFTDHGGQFPRAKQFCYKEGLHVPLLIVAPMLKDKVKPGTRRKDLVNLMDISATALALCGLDIPGYFDSKNVFETDYQRDYVFSSRDRCDFSIDRIRSVMGKRYHYIRNFKTDRPLYQLNYRSGYPSFKAFEKLYKQGKLTPAQAAGWEARVAEELYDLEKDPHEVVNLAKSEEYQKILGEMRQQLTGWLKDTDDKGHYGESKASLKATKKRWRKKCINPEYEGL